MDFAILGVLEPHPPQTPRDDCIVIPAKALTNRKEGSVSRKKILFPGVDFLVAIWKLLRYYWAWLP